MLVRTRDDEQETASGCLEVLRAVDAWTVPPAPLGRIDVAVKDKVLNLHEAVNVEELTFALSSAGGRALTLRKLRKHATVVMSHAKAGGAHASAALARAALLNERVARWTEVSDEVLVRETLTQACSLLDYAETVLAKSKSGALAFVAGASWTVADAALTAFLARLQWFTETRLLLRARPALAAYWERVRIREAFKHAHVNDSHHMGHSVDDALHSAAAPFLSIGAWVAAHPLPPLRFADVHWDPHLSAMRNMCNFADAGMRALWSVSAVGLGALGTGIVLVFSVPAIGLVSLGSLMGDLLHAPSMACWRSVNGYVVTPGLEAHNQIWNSGLKLITPAIEGAQAAAADLSNVASSMLPASAAAPAAEAPEETQAEAAAPQTAAAAGAVEAAPAAAAAAAPGSGYLIAGALARHAKRASAAVAAAAPSLGKALGAAEPSSALSPELMASITLTPPFTTTPSGQPVKPATKAVPPPPNPAHAGLTPVQIMRLETRKVIVATTLAPYVPLPSADEAKKDAPSTDGPQEAGAAAAAAAAVPTALLYKAAAAVPEAPPPAPALSATESPAVAWLVGAASSAVGYSPIPVVGLTRRALPEPDAPRAPPSARALAEARLARYEAAKANDLAAFALFALVASLAVFVAILASFS